MLHPSFRTALRNLWQNRAYSSLNTIGLSVGLASVAFILLWVEDEMNFNHNFTHRNQLYRVMQNEKNDRGVFTNGSTPGPLADALQSDIPGVENSVRLSWAMDERMVVGDKSTKENGIYADPSILSMFSLDLLRGNAVSALKQPQDVVISESMAIKFFGADNPIGKPLRMNANQGYSVDGLYTVTGVFKDLPANCTYHFQWVSPYQTWETANPWLKPWSNNLTETIVQLASSSSPTAIDQQLSHYLGRKVTGAENSLFLFSMNDWHLRGNFENGLQTGGTIRYVHLFQLIAIAILLIACINFMNLATARSDKRAKEVSVLKVMGAGRARLVAKFISEALLLSALAVLLAIGLVYFLLPEYNLLVNKSLSFHLLQFSHWSGLLTIWLLSGVIAGSYPAFYLSAFNPLFILKGIKIKNSGPAVLIRKGLVIVQFSASVTLIICTIIIWQQVQHIKTRDLGYRKERLLYIDLQGNLKKDFGALRSKLISTGYVDNAATSLHDALHVYSYGSGLTWQGKDANSKISVHSNVVSPEYIATMQMQLLNGRNFYPGAATDSTNVIINETMAKLMGTEGRVGSILGNGSRHFQVVGILKDFIYNDIYGAGAPLVLFSGLDGATVLSLRINQKADLPSALAAIRLVMTSENPGYPFEFHFADEGFDALFADETLIGKLAGLFATLAVFISCLGLFGLAAYTAERRAKEIGIRKVLGASIQEMAGLLSKEFLKLIVISCLIAFPLAGWAMSGWLQGYEYRTSLQWWVFAFAGSLALVIALLTVSFQAIRTALANPIQALRRE